MPNAKISDIAAFTPPVAGGDLLEIERAGASYKVTAADLVTAAHVGRVIGVDIQAYDADLAALAALASTGLTVRTGAGTVAARTLTAPAAGITVSNGNGVAGDPTLALVDDLAALEALSGTNTIYYRSADNTWSAVTIGSNLAFNAGTLSASAPSITPNAQSGTTYTVVAGDAGKLLRLTNVAAVAVTLPQATGSFAAGFFFYATAAGAGGAVITPTTSTINGKASYQLRQGGTVLVVSDGTNYQVVPMAALYGGATGEGYSLSLPDGSALGGNARGANAVDLQTSRSSATKVASGATSVTAGLGNTASNTSAVALGENNLASGAQSFAGGDSNNATGAHAVTLGYSNTASQTEAISMGRGCNVSAASATGIGNYNTVNGAYSIVLGTRGNPNSNTHQFCLSGEGTNFTTGSGQTRFNMLYNFTTGASAVRLTSDGAAAGANNIAAPFTGGMVSYTAEVVIFDITNQKSNTYTFALSSIAKPTTAASTVMGSGNPSAVAGPTTGGGLTLAAVPTITADTTNGGFNVSYTPPAGNTAELRAVCRIFGTDMV